MGVRQSQADTKVLSQKEQQTAIFEKICSSFSSRRLVLPPPAAMVAAATSILAASTASRLDRTGLRFLSAEPLVVLVGLRFIHAGA